MLRYIFDLEIPQFKKLLCDKWRKSHHLASFLLPPHSFMHWLSKVTGHRVVLKRDKESGLTACIKSRRTRPQGTLDIHVGGVCTQLQIRGRCYDANIRRWILMDGNQPRCHTALKLKESRIRLRWCMTCNLYIFIYIILPQGDDEAHQVAYIVSSHLSLCD